MPSQFITGIFKLHNPSPWRRKVLDHAFEQYTLAMTDLLVWCESHLDMIRKEGIYKKRDQYTGKSVARVLPKSSEIDRELASCIKEALIDDVASGIASFLENEKTNEATGFPTSRDPSPQGYPNALRDLAQVGNDKDGEDKAIARLMKRAKVSVMPLQYKRSRDFAILIDTRQQRFFTKLSLLPGRHELGRRMGADKGNLVNIQTGEVLSYNGSSEILLPIELGIRQDDWHWQYERFILPVMAGDASIRSGKLVRKENDRKHEYFLHVSFEFECPEPYEPQAFLGIDKGILFSMAYGIVDLDGNIVEMGHEEDGLRNLQLATGIHIRKRQKRGQKVTVGHFKTRQRNAILHELINRILDLAQKHRAAIVLEDLNIQVRGKYVKSSWKKMEGFLGYKAKLRGVPIYGNVFAAYSSQICIRCGEIAERDDRILTCHYCGAIEHSDETGGVNIARRAMYRKKTWEGGYREFHRSFANLDGFATVSGVAKREKPETQDIVANV